MRCYLCNAETSERALPSGVIVCGKCKQREGVAVAPKLMYAALETPPAFETAFLSKMRDAIIATIDSWPAMDLDPAEIAKHVHCQIDPDCPTKIHVTYPVTDYEALCDQILARDAIAQALVRGDFGPPPVRIVGETLTKIEGERFPVDANGCDDPDCDADAHGEVTMPRTDVDAFLEAIGGSSEVWVMPIAPVPETFDGATRKQWAAMLGPSDEAQRALGDLFPDRKDES